MNMENLLGARLIFILFFILFRTGNANAFSLFGPSNYEDCEVSAAKDAKSEQALQILIKKCNSDFPARKSQQGGYFYFEPNSKEWIPVSSPKMTKLDWEKVSQAIAVFELEQTKRENELRKRAEETKLRKEADDKLRSETNAAVKAELLSGISVMSFSYQCKSTYNCRDKNFTVKLKNNSKHDIRMVGFGILLTPVKQDCTGTHSENAGSQLVDLGAGDTTVINFTQNEFGPVTSNLHGCIWVTSVRLSSGNEYIRLMK